MAAAPTAVCKHHDTVRFGWDIQITDQREWAECDVEFGRRRSGRWNRLARTTRRRTVRGQDVVHIGVGDCVEASIPPTYGSERLRGFETDHAICFGSELLDHIGRRDGDGHGDGRRTVGPRHENRGAHRRTGRNPIVDDHDRPTSGRFTRMSRADRAETPVEFESFVRLDGSQLLLTDVGRPDHIRIEHQLAALTDRTHRQFRLERDPQFAHDDHVERRLNRIGDLGRNRDTTARQPEHQRAGQLRLGDFSTKLAPGLATILEHVSIHGVSFPYLIVVAFRSRHQGRSALAPPANAPCSHTMYREPLEL